MIAAAKPDLLMMPAVPSRLRRGMLLLLGLACGCSVAHAEPPDYSRTPVLFVHGHGLSSADWRPLIAHLTANGYPRESLRGVDIVPNTMANVRAATSVIAPEAAALLARAEAAARRAGYSDEVPRRLDIVSHSMGVVSSRWYATKLRPELVRTWIGLAGANHGTNVLCAFYDEAAREMCPAFGTGGRRNAVQLALNGADGAWIDETPYGLGLDRPGVPRVPSDGTRSILYLTVRVEPDRWIQPERSAVLDGAGGVPIQVPAGVPVRETSPGNFLFEAPVGHDPLLYHPDLLRLVTAMLTARDRTTLRGFHLFDSWEHRISNAVARGAVSRHAIGPAPRSLGDGRHADRAPSGGGFLG